MKKISELATDFWPVQSAPGSVADQLIKKGEVIGEELGKAREKANTIRILRSLLSVPHSTDEGLSDKTLNDLQAAIDSELVINHRPSNHLSRFDREGFVASPIASDLTVEMVGPSIRITAASASSAIAH